MCGGFFCPCLAAIAIARWRFAFAVVYTLSLAVAASALVSAAMLLPSSKPRGEIVLPIGLPWLGAHFKIDALPAFFLSVIHLWGAAAGLFGLGYGRHEEQPQRVLPFVPAFLAGMNLVVVANDAFSLSEVDASSCNGCEHEIQALNNAYYGVERFGLRFVASPRHADVLPITGPVTREALERTYRAVPDPK